MHIHGRMLVIRVTLHDDTCWRWCGGDNAGVGGGGRAADSLTPVMDRH